MQSGRDGAKSKREVVLQRLEDMDDQVSSLRLLSVLPLLPVTSFTLIISMHCSNLLCVQNLDKQQNVRKLKDDILSSQAATEETAAAAKKLEKEIKNLVVTIAAQEKALQSDDDRHSAQDEMVAPVRGHRTHEGELDAFAVSMLPRGLPGRGNGRGGWH
jgi:septal ring factor EnvC (AmiA/AmiB activator)